MKSKIHDDVGVVSLKKKMMGLPETDQLYDEVSSLLSKGIKKIVLDLKNTAWMNSKGVGSVMRCYTTVRNIDGDLYLARLTEKTSHVFMITQLIKIFKIFDSVEEAVKETGANASVFFVPAQFVLDAFYETVDAGIKLIVVVPEHVPVHDVMKMRAYASEKKVLAIGPTTPGILVPGKGKMGIMPGSLFSPGRVGIISRSGTLSYEFAAILSQKQIGQSTVLGIGADPVVLANLPDILKLFEDDNGTDAVIIVGEVGGIQEEKAAEFIAQGMSKPIAS